MLIPSAYAQTAGSASAGGSFASFLSLAPLFLVFVVFYMLMIRPQQKRVRQLQTAIEGAKKNDQVVTGGGIVGKVTKVEDQHLEVEIAQNVRVRVVKATVTQVIPANSAKPAND